MNLFEIFNKKKQSLYEGGNLALDTGEEAQHIDLKVHNRAYIVPILDNLLQSINNLYAQQYQTPLWEPNLLKKKTFLSGSSLHFFNTDIPDDEFTRVKPKVGDIDTQVNKELEGNLEQFLTANQGKVMGPAKFLGFQRGNEQFSGLWEFTDPPIKVQIDLEFVAYDKKGPTQWSQFSHSSSWDDLQAGIKGVFHKFLIQSFTSLTNQNFILRKFVGRGKARAEQDFPTTDNMFSFAVSSKEGGGLRAKYEPVLDEKGRPLVIDNLPVMRPLKAEGYEQDLSKIFATIFGSRVNSAQLKKLMPKTWSFVGLLDLMNVVLDPEEKEHVIDNFVNKLFAPGAQGLYKNDPDRDVVEKNAALNQMLAILKVSAPANLEQMRQDYKASYRMTGDNALTTQPVKEAVEDTPDNAPVKAQFRKGMPHLHDLKPIDFLDLLDEIHDGNGNFKLENIPLNVKVDGFGGRFGKDVQGRPFMATSRTEPRYQAGFVKYHQEKGTVDPEILGRARLFDQLFNEMMSAVKLVDNKIGPDFLVNKQITCEVLYLPFATETPEGKLKFVGIAYDKLPEGVQLALVPFRVVDAATGEDLPNSNEVIKELLSVGRNGSVMFIDNSLTQKEGLDVTAIVPPLENIEQLRALLADKSAGSLQRKRDVVAALEPFKIALEKAIIEDPNIIGKDILGQDYEGIVINSRLGPIKVTSQEQRDVITAKNAAKANARTERPRGESKIAVVAIGSFVGHRGHEELFNYTINKAAEVGGDPYLFMGNAVGKDDPIPVDVKLQTWHKMYPEYAKNISGTQQGGSLMQKIKHELINPLPGKPPRYDNVIIMVGEDQASMPIAGALMKAVNKFQGYEHVKVSLEPTPRGTGMSFTKLRNILKDPNATPEQQYAVWAKGFDEAKLGKDWILHLMDITKKGMGVPQQPAVQPAPVVAERLSMALIRPRLTIAELSNEKLGQYKKAAGVQASAADQTGNTKKADKRFSGIVKATKKQFANDEKSVNEFAPGNGGGESGRWYTDDQMTDLVGDGWWQDMDVGGDIPKQQMIEQAQAWLDDQGYSVQVLNCKVNDDDMEWFIEGNFHNPGFAKKGVAEQDSTAMAHTAKSLENPPKVMQHRARRDQERNQQWLGTQIANNDKTSKDEWGNLKEKMMPDSNFAGTPKNKLGSAAHLKGSMKRPARAGDLVGGGAEESVQHEAKKKGADGKACWDGYRYNGTENDKDKCVKVSKKVENIMDALINKIIVNEAIQNNK